ncbi:hypothetical protein Q3Y53_02785 [Synechococcus sp. YX-04-1]|uniref:hypothetical protein n=1 Tax=Synechococcus sp. YX-04-1 TaxID=3062778 RepID=UPI0026E22F3F|nr:hypothetical protein [Synechococcus sp. YX-04-1]MDO6351459.1 hypothetical protein [Synechococcus sp. YX-04-1]
MKSKITDRNFPLSSGMSILELLLAITMIMVFTGVVVAVMEVTLRFMGEAECPVDVVDGERRCNDGETEDIANGTLIDRQSIEVLFDKVEQVLVQPGINSLRIKSISGKNECTDTASISPWRDELPELPSLTLPRGYHFCLWPIGAPALEEASMVELVGTNSSAMPGLYALQALPTKLNASTLPVRRLICRPRPFC